VRQVPLLRSFVGVEQAHDDERSQLRSGQLRPLSLVSSLEHGQEDARLRPGLCPAWEAQGRRDTVRRDCVGVDARSELRQRVMGWPS
jgi:hypothetical protein